MVMIHVARQVACKVLSVAKFHSDHISGINAFDGGKASYMQNHEVFRHTHDVSEWL